jgi:hypothetical protein
MPHDEKAECTVAAVIHTATAPVPNRPAATPMLLSARCHRLPYGLAGVDPSWLSSQSIGGGLEYRHEQPWHHKGPGPLTNLVRGVITPPRPASEGDWAVSRP